MTSYDLVNYALFKLRNVVGGLIRAGAGIQIIYWVGMKNGCCPTTFISMNRVYYNVSSIILWCIVRETFAGGHKYLYIYYIDGGQNTIIIIILYGSLCIF